MKYPPQKSFTYLKPIFSFYKQGLFENKTGAPHPVWTHINQNTKHCKSLAFTPTYSKISKSY